MASHAVGGTGEELERELGIAGSIKLASNESPLGPPPAALAAMRPALADVALYPDGSGFRLALSPSGGSSPAEQEVDAEPASAGTEGATAEQRPEMP